MRSIGSKHSIPVSLRDRKESLHFLQESMVRLIFWRNKKYGKKGASGEHSLLISECKHLYYGRGLSLRNYHEMFVFMLKKLSVDFSYCSTSFIQNFLIWALFLRLLQHIRKFALSHKTSLISPNTGGNEVSDMVTAFILLHYTSSSVAPSLFQKIHNSKHILNILYPSNFLHPDRVSLFLGERSSSLPVANIFVSYEPSILDQFSNEPHEERRKCATIISRIQRVSWLGSSILGATWVIFFPRPIILLSQGFHLIPQLIRIFSQKHAEWKIILRNTANLSSSQNSIHSLDELLQRIQAPPSLFKMSVSWQPSGENSYAHTSYKKSIFLYCNIFSAKYLQRIELYVMLIGK